MIFDVALNLKGRCQKTSHLIQVYNYYFPIRTNRELEVLSNGENIVKWIKGQRVSWLGHLERMEEDRMPKKNWKGRDEEEDPGKDGEKWKEIFKCWE
jgi:hypothetical protein